MEDARRYRQEADPQGSEAADDGPSLPADEGMMEKIREILLGADKREMQRRMAELEARLGEALEDHRRTVTRRFEKLELRIQRDLDRLEAELQAEGEERRESCQELRDFTEAVRGTVERYRADLETNKLDRYAMAEVLVETAVQLTRKEEASGDGD